MLGFDTKWNGILYIYCWHSNVTANTWDAYLFLPQFPRHRRRIIVSLEYLPYY